jgi:glycosyltransferase involved in cell wall biosynthesis
MNFPNAVSSCDLHMHSAASVMNDEWYTRVFGCPESYADPVRQYDLCKARGMTLVTLTDHDSIAGGLRLRDRPDFFLSEEVTTRFPENGCVMHVLVWNITEAQHLDIQDVRDNIYHLVRYLRATKLAHALAHPFLSSNWRLDATTFERSLVLFPTLEVCNGLVDRRTDASMAHLLTSLTPNVVETLARKHGLELPEGGARRPAACAGSDDHVHRRCGTVYTETDGALDPAAFLDRVMHNQARVVGSTADMNRMSACIKHTTYEHCRHECGLSMTANSPFVDLMESVAGRVPAITSTTSRTAAALLESLAAATQKLPHLGDPALDVGHIADMPSAEDDAKITGALAQVSDALLAKSSLNLITAVQDFDIYSMLAALPDLTGAVAAATPILFAADHFAKQESQVRRVWCDFTAFPPPPRTPEHLAVFSDSLDKIDGVATWCSRFGQQANKAGRRVWFASCDKLPSQDPETPEMQPLPLVSRFSLPMYPGFDITIPSLPATLQRLWKERITHVEVSTPGPMGLAGLVAARLLRLPITASYHTDLPDMISMLTGEPGLAKLARRYLGWFYRSVDRVFAFSAASHDKLVAMGVPPDKIERMPVAVDPTDFSPHKSSTATFSNLGIDARDRPILLSVGRLSEEKNLPLIINAVDRLQGRANPPLLLIVGDGPARASLELKCADKEFVVFLGFKQGEVLRNLYASACVFIFASRVDTLGLVNLEALASGVPILVPSDSAIAQSLHHGENALFFTPEVADLSRTIEVVLDDPACATRLSEGGRRHVLARWESADFERVWKTMVRTSWAGTPS